jgi:hypothetical protein
MQQCVSFFYLINTYHYIFLYIYSMKIEQISYVNHEWVNTSTQTDFEQAEADLVLVFGERTLLENLDCQSIFLAKYPKANIVYCSTSGEIYENGVHDNTIVATAIQFDKTKVKAVVQKIANHLESSDVGQKLATSLLSDDLNSVLIISDGSLVNGSDLIKGMDTIFNHKISISGGLAGDQDRFEKTVVGLNANPESGNIVAIGFYGQQIRIGHGTMGGWDVFGPEREITEAKYNVVYKIGNKSALELYKEYLGKYASELPGAALLFPLSLKIEDTEETVVRTILSISEEDQSMTFAGEMPVNSKIRFMKANFDRIISASEEAAFQSIENHSNPELAILISCIGRKLVLGERIDEEVEAVKTVFGSNTIITGFYSYGEISPHLSHAKCELHNQTMTITTFSEL